MMNIQQLIHTSRPRFWIYLLGPYIIGLTAHHSLTTLNWTMLLAGLFFTLPANLFLYGINDIFDWETDKLNPKKLGYEVLIKPQDRSSLITSIFILLIPSIGLFLYTNLQVILTFAAFLFLGLFYSAPPIRAKTKPFLDSFFNSLYILPAILGYFLVGGTILNWYLILAGGLWTIAMHAYSAIPDISSDQEAKIRTIATYLGQNKTLVFCTFSYLASALLAGSQIGPVAYVLGMIYLIMMRLSFQSKSRNDLFKTYRYFPLINILSGFILFMYILVSLHS